MVRKAWLMPGFFLPIKELVFELMHILYVSSQFSYFNILVNFLFWQLVKKNGAYLTFVTKR